MALSSKELAQELGVSPSAVSIALHGRKGISEATRARILAAAESRGIARREPRAADVRKPVLQLAIFKKHGLVIGDTPFFASVIEGVTREAAAAGYDLALSYLYSNQDLEEQLRALRSRGGAGTLLLATEALEEDLPAIRRLPAPLVLLDSDFETEALDAVVIDNVQGAYLATRHLLENGHRSIGHLRSSVDIHNFRERRYGFLKALDEARDAGAAEGASLRLESTSDGAYRDMARFLATGAPLPTAFFADNDIIATSAIRALKEAGVRIPHDVSVVGFDDMPFANVVSPRLATMHVPKEALGVLAVRVLTERIAVAERPGGEEPATWRHAVRTWLKPGESVRRL